MPDYFKRVHDWLTILDTILRGKASGALEWEVQELEHIFGLLCLGMFVGMPAPPAGIALDVLPEMEHEFSLLLERVDLARDPLSQLFSVLDVT